MVVLLATLCLMVSPLSALAQSSTVPPGLGSGPINKITTSDGMTSYHDTHGNRVNTYTSQDGVTTYHSEHGSGTIYEQNAYRPLRAPESVTPPRDPRAGCTEASKHVRGCR